jgi:AraC-like DNA-binding protein
VSPYLELVEIQEQESFKVWTHGYPYPTVRWHFHPEYEINLVTDTSGHCFVGDHIGSFRPGHLFMVGPDLPHNWISDVPDEQPVLQRCVVLQFSGKCVTRAIAAFPELRHIERLLAESERGIRFADEIALPAAAQLNALLAARGFQRIQLFLALLDGLAQSRNHTLLATPEFKRDPEAYRSSTINQVLTYIADHAADALREADLATYAGMTPSAFSRFFRRHTGLPFVQYLSRLRVTRACELLIGSEKSITEVCYAVGFNNVSNFNRQFLALKAMPPSQFRRVHRMNAVFETQG